MPKFKIILRFCMFLELKCKHTIELYKTMNTFIANQMQINSWWLFLVMSVKTEL